MGAMQSRMLIHIKNAIKCACTSLNSNMLDFFYSEKQNIGIYFANLLIRWRDLIPGF